VPQYTNLSLTGNLTAPPWDGETGGVMARDGQFTIRYRQQVN